MLHEITYVTYLYSITCSILMSDYSFAVPCAQGSTNINESEMTKAREEGHVNCVCGI